MFDETLALRKTGISQGGLPFAVALKMTTRGVLRDTIRIARDPSYGLLEKIKWTLINPFFHVEKWRGVYKASNIDLKDSEKLRKHSLEASKKSNNKT